MLFSAARATLLEFFHSDHRPIWLKLYEDQPQNSIGRRVQAPVFRFEKYWLLEDECKSVIEKGWGSPDLPWTLMERISSCKEAFLCWNNIRFRRFTKKLKSKKDQLNSLRTSSRWNNNGIQIKKTGR